MRLTDYHAKYFAHELTRRCPSDSVEKLAGALVDAQVNVDTQPGPYNPDWAILLHDETQVLYVVCETKSTTDADESQSKEINKIACGRKHYDAIGVDYDVAMTLSEVLRRLRSRRARTS